MIDFPDTPIHGTTYEYLGVAYIYKKLVGTVGFWQVSTVGTYGPALASEIDEGTDAVKYVTPLELNNSGYLREDEAGSAARLNEISSSVVMTEVVPFTNVHALDGNITSTTTNTTQVNIDVAAKAGDIVNFTMWVRSSDLPNFDSLLRISVVTSKWSIAGSSGAITVVNEKLQVGVGVYKHFSCQGRVIIDGISTVRISHYCAETLVGSDINYSYQVVRPT